MYVCVYGPVYVSMCVYGCLGTWVLGIWVSESKYGVLLVGPICVCVYGVLLVGVLGPIGECIGPYWWVYQAPINGYMGLIGRCMGPYWWVYEGL